MLLFVVAVVVVVDADVVADSGSSGNIATT